MIANHFSKIRPGQLAIENKPCTTIPLVPEPQRGALPGARVTNSEMRKSSTI